MGIQEDLAQILSARYGKDVRQSIHDAIYDCYEDGRAGAVDLVAREKIEEIDNPATTEAIGLVKPDGTSITIDADGTLHGSSAFELPIASTTTLGGVKVDGTSIVAASDGTISSEYDLPVASSTTLGGVKVDNSTITISSNGTISASGGSGGSTFGITFSYEVAEEITISNESYTLTVGSVTRTGSFSPSALVKTESGVSGTGTVALTVSYDVTNAGETTAVEISQTLEAPYFGRYDFSVLIAADAYGYSAWLATISKTASSLSEVLGNESLVRELMTRHASADYFCEWMENKPEDFADFVVNRNAIKWIGLRDYICDKLMAISTIKSQMLNANTEFTLSDGTTKKAWEYILKDNVPKMTSNTAPCGQAISSGSWSSEYDAWMAFDADDTNGWNAPNGDGNGTWIGYKFVNPIKVSKVFLHPTSIGGMFLKNYKIQASNDGFSTIAWQSEEKTHPSTATSGATITIDTDGYYLAYRLIATSSSYRSDGRVNMATLQFYGRSLNESVPVMTSNTSPYGEAITKTNASDIMSNDSAENNYYKVFDRDNSTKVYGTSSRTDIGYHFPIKTSCRQVWLTSSADGYLGSTVTVQGSNDKFTSDIHDLHSATIGSIGNNQVFNYAFENTSAYYDYRVVLTPKNGYSQLAELQFYGVSYSEEEFGDDGIVMLYDNGVETDGEITIDHSSGQTNGTYSKVEDYIYWQANGTYSIYAHPPVRTLNYKYFAIETREVSVKTSQTASIASTADADSVAWASVDVFTGKDYASSANTSTSDRSRFVVDISNVSGQYNMYARQFTGTSGNNGKVTKLWCVNN